MRLPAYHDRTFFGYLSLLDGRSWMKLSQAVSLRYYKKFDVIELEHNYSDMLFFTRWNTFSAVGRGYKYASRARTLNAYGPVGVAFWHRRFILQCNYGECGEGIFYPMPVEEVPVPEKIPNPPRLTFTATKKRRTIRRLKQEDC